MNQGIRVYQGHLSPYDIQQEAESRIRNLKKESEEFQPLKRQEEDRQAEIDTLQAVIDLIEGKLACNDAAR